MHLVGICGKAGSGKDSIARHLVENHGYAQIAWADPVKRMTSDIFDFTEDQLWGPSERRNEPDPRYTSERSWDLAEEHLRVVGGSWVSTLLGTELFTADVHRAYETLLTWFDQLRKSCQPLCPRLALQTLGTEWGREQVHEDLWVSFAMQTVHSMLRSTAPFYAYDRYKGLTPAANPANPQGVVISDIRFENELSAIPNAGGCLVHLSRPAPPQLGDIFHHKSESEQETFDAGVFNAMIVNDGSLSDLFADVDTVITAIT